MSEARDKEIGIAIRFVQQFDAEEDRVESLKRAAEEIRAWQLWHWLQHVRCSETVQ